MLPRFQILRAPTEPSAAADGGTPGDGVAPTTTETIDTGEVTESDDFAGLDFGSEDDGLDESPVGGSKPSAAPAPATDSPATSQTPAQPAEPKPAESQAATPPVEEKPKAPEEKPAEASKAAAAEAAPKRTLMEEIDAARDTIISELATGKFKLTEAEQQAFESGDPQVVPQIAAKIYFEAVRAAMAAMEHFTPQLVQAAVVAQTTQKSMVDEFMSNNEDLKPHQQELLDIGQKLRQLHPTMPSKEFIPLLEETVRIFLKKPRPTGAAPAVAQPAPRPSNGAFTPAVSSVPAGPAVTAQPVDEWFGFMGE